MGVRGLGVHLRKNNLKGEQEVLRRGDTLVIDGLGWAHHILGRKARVDHGGDYDTVHEAASLEIERLRACGINIRVYKDGNALHTMKVVQASSRIASLVDQYATLHGETGGSSPSRDPAPHGNPGDGGSARSSSSSGSGSSSSDGEDGARSAGDPEELGDAHHEGGGIVNSTIAPAEAFDMGVDNGGWLSRTEHGWQGKRGFPKPRLLTQQLFATVQDAGVELVSCDGEADLELARTSAQDPSGRTFVLGSDNDFLFFERCRYITFGSIKFTPEGVTAPVWTRAHLARLVGLTESQVVEWALLVGNDFTGWIYDSMEFEDLPKMMLRRGRSPHETLWWLRTQHPDFRIRADLRKTYEAGVRSVADVEFANLSLDFSRALYNLQPLEDISGRWQELQRTLGVVALEGADGAGEEEGDLDGRDDDDLLQGGGAAAREEPMGCMWPPFRDAPASLSEIASTYGCPAPREDLYGDQRRLGDRVRGGGGGGGRGRRGGEGAGRWVGGGGGVGVKRREDSNAYRQGCLENPHLVEQVLARPWGDIALEAIRATVIPREGEDESWVEADEAQTVALFWCALGKRKTLEEHVQPTWRDIVIALNYQGHLWRLYRRYRFQNPALNAPMPCAHFHGPTFHAAAREFREYAEARSLEGEGTELRCPEDRLGRAAARSTRRHGAAPSPPQHMDPVGEGEAVGGAGSGRGLTAAGTGVQGNHVLAAR